MAAQPTTLFLDVLADAIRGLEPPLSVAGTSSAVSNSITAMGSLAGVAIGDVISGPGFVAGQTVVAMDNAAHIVTASAVSGAGPGAGTFIFTPAPSNTFTVGLFTGAPVLGVATTLAALAALAPVYPGYAAQTVTLGAERSDANNDLIAPVSPTTWQPSADPIATQIVTGVYIAVNGTDLWLAEMLAAPFDVVSALSALDLLLEIYAPNQQVYGIVCATCR